MSAKNAILFYYKMAIIPFILFLIVGVASRASLSSNTPLNAISWIIFTLETSLIWHRWQGLFYLCTTIFKGAWLVVASGIFYMFILYPIIAVVYALIYHGVWKNFLQQLKAPFSATLTATIFSTIATASFAWLIPSFLYSTAATWGFILSFIVFIWGLVVLTIALSGQHNITRHQALGGVFILGFIALFGLGGATLFFNIGVFGGAAFIGTACISNSGYFCSSPYINQHTGKLNVTIGQATGQDWVTANIIFSNSPQTNYNAIEAEFASVPQNVTTIPYGLSSGGTADLNLAIPHLSFSGPPGFVCQPILDGTIWVQYQTYQGGPFEYSQIATLSLR